MHMIKIHNFHHKWFSMFYACCCRLHLGMTTALLKMNIFNLCLSSLFCSFRPHLNIHNFHLILIIFTQKKEERKKKNKKIGTEDARRKNILIEFFICISGMCTIFFMHIKVFSLNKLMLELFSCGNISLNIEWRT